MTGLAEWLLEAITDDEAAALAEAERRRDQALATVEAVGVAYVEFGGPFDPARVLAECAAKRAIVALHDHPEGSCWEMHRGVYGPGWPEGSYAVEGQPWAHPSLEGPDIHPGPCETLQLLAAPYADRPGFREEWRV